MEPFRACTLAAQVEAVVLGVQEDAGPQVAVIVVGARLALDVRRGDALELVELVEPGETFFHLADGGVLRVIAVCDGVGQQRLAVEVALSAMLQSSVLVPHHEVFVRLAVAVVVRIVALFRLGVRRVTDPAGPALAVGRSLAGAQGVHRVDARDYGRQVFVHLAVTVVVLAVALLLPGERRSAVHPPGRRLADLETGARPILVGEPARPRLPPTVFGASTGAVLRDAVGAVAGLELLARILLRTRVLGIAREAAETAVRHVYAQPLVALGVVLARMTQFAGLGKAEEDRVPQDCHPLARPPRGAILYALSGADKTVRPLDTIAAFAFVILLARAGEFVWRLAARLAGRGILPAVRRLPRVVVPAVDRAVAVGAQPVI